MNIVDSALAVVILAMIPHLLCSKHFSSIQRCLWMKYQLKSGAITNACYNKILHIFNLLLFELFQSLLWFILNRVCLIYALCKEANMWKLYSIKIRYWTMNSPVSEGLKIRDTRIFPFLSLYSFTCLRQTFFIKQPFRATTALKEQHYSPLWALCTHQATLFVGPQVRLVGSHSGRFEYFSQMGEKQWSRVC